MWVVYAILWNSTSIPVRYLTFVSFKHRFTCCMWFLYKVGNRALYVFMLGRDYVDDDTYEVSITYFRRFFTQTFFQFVYKYIERSCYLTLFIHFIHTISVYSHLCVNSIRRHSILNLNFLIIVPSFVHHYIYMDDNLIQFSDIYMVFE